MYLSDSVLDVLMPRYCKVCGGRLTVSERHLCASCFMDMPLIEYEAGKMSPAENQFASERNVVRAASLFVYEKESSYRNILYHLKYYNHPQVGVSLAEFAGMRLLRAGFFEGIECIVPVPLSARKYRFRGYNQCEYIARGLSNVTGLPVSPHALIRHGNGSAQAKQGRFQRLAKSGDSEYSLSVDGLKLAESHILLVDDVVTTGATIRSITGMLLSQCRQMRVSVFSLALAH